MTIIYEEGFNEFNKAFPVIEPLSFPTNEGNFTVLERIISDCRDSKNVLIISGYAGLDQVISFISNHAINANIRIVFGNEPRLSSGNSITKSSAHLAEELRDHWLERGLSPRTDFSVNETIRSIEEGRVSVKIHTKRFLHAKAYLSDTAVTIGSSNFSTPGLKTSRELNARYMLGADKEYSEVSKFMEGCWEHSEDYTQELLALLRELQLHTTWEEALARACAAILEGHWAMDLLPPNLKADLDQLWPHQKQAIAQALTVLENQGAVVICDPTGAGKTREGGWLFRLAYNRLIARGGENMNSLIPVMISPPSVANNWYRILDKVSVPREIISQGILSNTKRESTKRRLRLIGKTNLLGVDEAHNYYNKTSKRTKMLTNNLADYRILLTATPINREFRDLIKLMNLLGTAELDGDTFQRMKKLEEKINDNNPREKERARKEARELVQRFMVRRTRNEIKQMVRDRPHEYRLEDRIANYPEYISEDYSLCSEVDNYLVEQIEELVHNIRGLTRLKELRQSAKAKESGITEDTYLKMRLNSSSALSKHQVWDTLDSSVAALYEHIHGTKAAENKFGVNTGKGQNPSHGMLNSLKEMGPPIWRLSGDLIDSENTPDWVTDPEKFSEIKKEEINNYQQIIDLAMKLTNRRQEAKLDAIREGIVQNKKPLAFDSSIITLTLFEKILQEEGIDTELYTGSDGRTKKSRVDKAEKIFGLNSEDIPVVGLLSDCMSEGINLQGSSLLINLTRPSTIKDAEQRAGRVDRMDTKFDQITIKYPERDKIASKKAPHLIQRAKLVRDLIGSNIKLPEEYEGINPDEHGGELSTTDFGEGLFKDRDGLLDAFHGIRNLIGEEGLVTNETYEMMRTSEARVASCVGLVQSETPWCFAVVQTNKNWAPQWIFLDWSKREATSGKGITTESNDICSSLRELLGTAENITPTEYSDRWNAKYLDFLTKNEFETLSMRKQHLLRQLTRVVNSWQKKFGYHTDIGEELGQLRRTAMGSSSDSLDMREIATRWSSFVREYRDQLEIKNRNKRNKNIRVEDLLKQNPPNMETFLGYFSDIPSAEEFDSRVVAFIAGIPKAKY